MNRYGLTFHHLGLAVRGPEKARRWLSGLDYEIGPTVRDDVQNVQLALCEHATMPRVELVWPTEVEGPLTSMLRANAELVYHACYEASDLDRAIASIKLDLGTVRCVSGAKPAVLFDGRRVSFHFVSGFGLVELLEARR